MTNVDDATRDFMDLDALANAYLRRDSEQSQEHRWASRRVDEIVRNEPNQALELTLMLLKKAGDDDRVLAYIAAGPLEDLLKRHGIQVIKRIEKEADGDSRLQLALSGVWGISRENPIFDRWYAMMCRYGFAEGKPQPL